MEKMTIFYLFEGCVIYIFSLINYNPLTLVLLHDHDTINKRTHKQISEVSERPLISKSVYSFINFKHSSFNFNRKHFA